MKDATLNRLQTILSKLTIREIMTPNPVTISPDDTIGQAAQLMLNYMIGGLPVMDHQGRLVGIITPHDVLRHFVERILPIPQEDA